MGLPSHTGHPVCGGLLHRRFTLTGCATEAARPAVCSLWHCPAGHPGSPLATTLPCGARTFLGGGFPRRRDRPADSSVVVTSLEGDQPQYSRKPTRRPPSSVSVDMSTSRCACMST